MDIAHIFTVLLLLCATCATAQGSCGKKGKYVCEEMSHTHGEEKYKQFMEKYKQFMGDVIDSGETFYPESTPSTDSTYFYAKERGKIEPSSIAPESNWAYVALCECDVQHRYLAAMNVIRKAAGNGLATELAKRCFQKMVPDSVIATVSNHGGVGGAIAYVRAARDAGFGRGIYFRNVYVVPTEDEKHGGFLYIDLNDHFENDEYLKDAMRAIFKDGTEKTAKESGEIDSQVDEEPFSLVDHSDDEALNLDMWLFKTPTANEDIVTQIGKGAKQLGCAFTGKIDDVYTVNNIGGIKRAMERRYNTFTTCGYDSEAESEIGDPPPYDAGVDGADVGASKTQYVHLQGAPKVIGKDDDQRPLVIEGVASVIETPFDDGGETWKTVEGVIETPSDDGGKTWKTTEGEQDTAKRRRRRPK